MYHANKQYECFISCSKTMSSYSFYDNLVVNFKWKIP